MGNFADLLIESCRRKGSRVVVGLDPQADRLPKGEDVVSFCRGIAEAAAPFAAAAKVQVAFFEALGDGGARAFRQVCEAARGAGLPVIADVKRGDIGSTAEAYAQAYLEGFPCDAITVNPYLGADSIEPYLRRCRTAPKGIFVLAKTSNPSSADFQDLDVGVGEPLYLRVARAAAGWGAELAGASGYSSVGIVVGATHPDVVARLRTEFPSMLFLLPGFGAQGAGARDVARAFDREGLGAVVNASRSILYACPKSGGPWREAAAEAARAMRDEIQAAVDAN